MRAFFEPSLAPQKGTLIFWALSGVSPRVAGTVSGASVFCLLGSRRYSSASGILSSPPGQLTNGMTFNFSENLGSWAYLSIHNLVSRLLQSCRSARYLPFHHIGVILLLILVEGGVDVDSDGLDTSGQRASTFTRDWD